MKTKLLSLSAVTFLIIVICLTFSACGVGQADIDLTTMNSTMVYSQVLKMVSKPSDYKGKIVKAKGTCDIYTDNRTGKNITLLS